MESMTFSEILFDKGSNKTNLQFVNGNVSYGQSATAGMGFSPKRPNGVTSKAKINNCISFIEEQQNFFCGSFTNGIYMETDTTAATLSCNNNVWTYKFLNNKAPYGKNGVNLLAAMLFIYCTVHFEKMYEESITSYHIAVQTLKTAVGSKITPEEAFLICDNFYYELLSNGVSTSTQFVKDELTTIEISTLNRNSSVTVLCDRYKSTFITKFKDKNSKKEKKKTALDTNKALFEAAQRGDYLLPIEWADEQWDIIPPLTFLEEYVPSDEFFVVLNLVRSRLVNILEGVNTGKDALTLLAGNLSNFIFCGKAGSGKSTAAKALAAALGLPLYVVPIQKNSEEDEFEGKTRAVQGSFNFVETDFLTGYEKGGLIILEEINLANAGVTMGGLGQAIVPPFVLKRNGFKETHRNPFTVICGTMNVGTQGSLELNEGLKSRFPLVMEMNEPLEDEMIGILSSKGYLKKDCKTVLKAYNSVVNFLHEQDMADLAMSVTLRHAIECLALMANGVSFHSACKYTLCGVIALSDSEIAQNVFETCIEPLK